VLRAAAARGAVRVVESPVHHAESAPRPDLGLVELLGSLSGGRALPDVEDRERREIRRRLTATIARELPERAPGRGDAADVEALSLALPHCELVTCDAFMADVVRRTRLDRRYGTELFTGRREDVRRLTARLAALGPAAP
jgi:hypothetical protein